MARILIVDNDELLRSSVKELLELHGIRTAAAGNGAEALRILTTEALPSAILLDLDMPVMGGREFHRIRMAMAGLAQIPCILLSGSSNLEQEAAAMGLGFLHKPFEPTSLLFALETVANGPLRNRPDGDGGRP